MGKQYEYKYLLDDDICDALALVDRARDRPQAVQAVKALARAAYDNERLYDSASALVTIIKEHTSIGDHLRVKMPPPAKNKKKSFTVVEAEVVEAVMNSRPLTRLRLRRYLDLITFAKQKKLGPRAPVETQAISATLLNSNPSSSSSSGEESAEEEGKEVVRNTAAEAVDEEADGATQQERRQANMERIHKMYRRDGYIKSPLPPLTNKDGREGALEAFLNYFVVKPPFGDHAVFEKFAREVFDSFTRDFAAEDWPRWHELRALGPQEDPVPLIASFPFLRRVRDTGTPASYLAVSRLTRERIRKLLKSKSLRNSTTRARLEKMLEMMDRLGLEWAYFTYIGVYRASLWNRLKTAQRSVDGTSTRLVDVVQRNSSEMDEPEDDGIYLVLRGHAVYFPLFTTNSPASLFIPSGASEAMAEAFGDHILCELPTHTNISPVGNSTFVPWIKLEDMVDARLLRALKSLPENETAISGLLAPGATMKNRLAGKELSGPGQIYQPALLQVPHLFRRQHVYLDSQSKPKGWAVRYIPDDDSANSTLGDELIHWLKANPHRLGWLIAAAENWSRVLKKLDATGEGGKGQDWTEMKAKWVKVSLAVPGEALRRDLMVLYVPQLGRANYVLPTAACFSLLRTATLALLSMLPSDDPSVLAEIQEELRIEYADLSRTTYPACVTPSRQLFHERLSELGYTVSQEDGLKLLKGGFDGKDPAALLAGTWTPLLDTTSWRSRPQFIPNASTSFKMTFATEEDGISSSTAFLYAVSAKNGKILQLHALGDGAAVRASDGVNDADAFNITGRWSTPLKAKTTTLDIRMGTDGYGRFWLQSCHGTLCEANKSGAKLFVLSVRAALVLGNNEALIKAQEAENLQKDSERGLQALHTLIAFLYLHDLSTRSPQRKLAAHERAALGRAAKVNSRRVLRAFYARLEGTTKDARPFVERFIAHNGGPTAIPRWLPPKIDSADDAEDEAVQLNAALMVDSDELPGADADSDDEPIVGPIFGPATTTRYPLHRSTSSADDKEGGARALAATVHRHGMPAAGKGNVFYAKDREPGGLVLRKPIGRRPGHLSSSSASQVSSNDLHIGCRFSIPVTIGTPGVSMRLGFDTGSQGSSGCAVWVASSEAASPQSTHTLFDPQLSWTQEPLAGSWSIPYGEGVLASGRILGQDCGLGNFTLPDCRLGLATAFSEDLLPADVDGMIAFGFPTRSTVETKMPALMGMMWEQEMVSKPLLSCYFAPEWAANQSFFTLGALDLSFEPENQMAWTPVDASDGLWAVDSPIYELRSSRCATKGMSAIIDTATEFVLLPDWLCSIVFGSIAGARLDADVGGYTLSQEFEMPKLKLSVGSTLLTLDREAMIYGDLGNGGWLATCQSGGTRNTAVFGTRLLEGHYLAFDMCATAPRFGVATPLSATDSDSEDSE